MASKRYTTVSIVNDSDDELELGDIDVRDKKTMLIVMMELLKSQTM